MQQAASVLRSASVVSRPVTTSSARPCKSRVAVYAQASRSDVTTNVSTSRRDALLSSIGIAFSASLALPRAAEAAYGESARVFGAKTKTSDFTQFVEDDFSVDIPAKWNPDGSTIKGSKLRYADNMRDDGANMDVIVSSTDKSSIEECGSLEAFLPKVSYLLGSQSFDGKTDSEGGFASGRVASGSILEQDIISDKKGKSYYFYHILTRTADGEGGGRHHLLVSTVSSGKLYTLQVQTLDKQWFKGQDKSIQAVAKSFIVA